MKINHSIQGDPMSQTKEVFNQGKLAAYKRKKTANFSGVTREEIDQAMNDYLKRGGKIKKVELDWIEENEMIIYQ